MQTEREEKWVSGWCKSMTDQLWPLWLLCSPFKQHLPLLYSSYPPDLPEQGLSSVIKYPRSGRNQCRMFTALGQRELMEKLLQTLSLPTGNRVAETKPCYLFLSFLDSSFILKHSSMQGKSQSISQIITVSGICNLFESLNLTINKQLYILSPAHTYCLFSSCVGEWDKMVCKDECVSVHSHLFSMTLHASTVVMTLLWLVQKLSSQLTWGLQLAPSRCWAFCATTIHTLWTHTVSPVRSVAHSNKPVLSVPVLCPAFVSTCKVEKHLLPFFSILNAKYEFSSWSKVHNQVTFIHFHPWMEIVLQFQLLLGPPADSW